MKFLSDHNYSGHDMLRFLRDFLIPTACSDLNGLYIPNTSTFLFYDPFKGHKNAYMLESIWYDEIFKYLDKNRQVD